MEPAGAGAMGVPAVPAASVVPACRARCRAFFYRVDLHLLHLNLHLQFHCICDSQHCTALDS